MSRILKLHRDDGKKAGGFVKVKVGRDVLAHFFHKDPERAVSVIEGLPLDAELVDFVYDAKAREGVAIFTHPFFPVTPQDDNGGIPFQEIVYQAYQVTQEEVSPICEICGKPVDTGKLHRTTGTGYAHDDCYRERAGLS